MKIKKNTHKKKGGGLKTLAKTLAKTLRLSQPLELDRLGLDDEIKEIVKRGKNSKQGQNDGKEFTLEDIKKLLKKEEDLSTMSMIQKIYEYYDTSDRMFYKNKPILQRLLAIKTLYNLNYNKIDTYFLRLDEKYEIDERKKNTGINNNLSKITYLGKIRETIMNNEDINQSFFYKNLFTTDNKLSLYKLLLLCERIMENIRIIRIPGMHDVDYNNIFFPLIDIKDFFNSDTPVTDFKGINRNIILTWRQLLDGNNSNNSNNINNSNDNKKCRESKDLFKTKIRDALEKAINYCDISIDEMTQNRLDLVVKQPEHVNAEDYLFTLIEKYLMLRYSIIQINKKDKHSSRRHQPQLNAFPFLYDDAGQIEQFYQLNMIHGDNKVETLKLIDLYTDNVFQNISTMVEQIDPELYANCPLISPENTRTRRNNNIPRGITRTPRRQALIRRGPPRSTNNLSPPSTNRLPPPHTTRRPPPPPLNKAPPKPPRKSTTTQQSLNTTV